MFGEHPVELGLREGDGFLPMLALRIPKYQTFFERPSRTKPIALR